MRVVTVDHGRLSRRGGCYAAAFAAFCSSDRSVAGGGARERSVICARSAGVMSTFTAASESFSWSTLRAPMMGAVIAGCVAT